MTHPAIRELFQSIGRQPELQQLVRAILSGETRPAAVSGLIPTAKALYLTLLWRLTERPLMLVTAGSPQAESLFELIQTFFELLVPERNLPRPLFIPALDVLPFQRLSPHSEISEQRATRLWKLATEGASIVVTSAASALLKVAPPAFYRQLAVTLRTGEEVPLDALVTHLASVGYEKRDPVEMEGEYSVRGGILDVFPADAERPVRIEFFGDTVEEIRRFDVETQRSVLKISACTILPLTEQPKTPELMERLGGEPGWEFLAAAEREQSMTVLEFLPEALVVHDEPEPLEETCGALWKRLEEEADRCVAPPEKVFYRWDELVRLRPPGLLIRELDLGAGSMHISTRPATAYHGNLPVALAETRTLVEQGYRVAFFAPSPGEIERLADICQEYELPFQLGMESTQATPQYLAERAYMAGPLASVYLIQGRVRRGAVLPAAKLALIGSSDLFETAELALQPARKGSKLTAFTADLADLKPGDYVVHLEHGIGRFLGVKELHQGGQSGDFMMLEYAGGAKLYVPLSRLDLVHRYRGAGDGAVSLDRIGGVTWNRTKSRVKAKMRDMADELLKLYASRKLAEGFAFSPDSNWQREFEESFEYTPTPDQLASLADIKRDMESPQPMDRLLCGDVGYGKTEVAMRAAFKALGDGKQVAVLAPTTVLAYQHYETFRRRFAPFPVRVELFSRFRSAKEIKQALEDLASGKVDIAIGTHRLLSKDVEFSDLGLLIVDEEQRFGVRHKERIKQLRRNIDVLTMTATPIPRTLHMSLLGIRDMSVIETPPKDRLAIHTVVAHLDPDLIRTAIEQELARRGQVYYIYNRVETIWERAASLQQLVPHARIAVGHGQMGEEALEKVILGFMRHESDVLVCTTIAENGLDIPLANTIIIENAERYGLAELYQLRGRVGRSNRRAYAYLLVPKDTELSEVARKRLAALKEFSDLGAGFKIAALDLELRGAGNLLGGEQHGHIAAVGFDMYVRLLEETVQELKGEQVRPEIHSTLNLGLDLRIPPDYIPDEQQRLRYYKRIADARNRDEAVRVLEELSDRYGEPPSKVRDLVEFSLLKSKAEQIGIEIVERRHGLLNIKFHPGARVEPAALTDLVRGTAGAQFTPAGVLRLPVHGPQDPSSLLALIRDLLEKL